MKSLNVAKIKICSVLDSEMAKHQFRVLRLPPYHPELNPIEKTWALVKNEVAARNTTFKMADVQKLTEQRFTEITPDTWASVCRHVDKVVEDYMKKEHIIDNTMEDIEFVANS
jgi:transposase